MNFILAIVSTGTISVGKQSKRTTTFVPELQYNRVTKPEINTNHYLDFVSGQYGCLFSRCRKYVLNSLIHGHFHIGLVIIPRPILALDSVSGQCGGLGMITRPIWKCSCINLYLFTVFKIQKLLNRA